MSTLTTLNFHPDIEETGNEPPVVIRRHSANGVDWVQISIGREFNLTVFGKPDINVRCPILGEDHEAFVEGRYHADQLIRLRVAS